MIFEIKQNDTFPPLRLRLTFGGGAVDLAGATIILRIAGIGNRNMVIESIVQNVVIVRYDWQAADTMAPGTFTAEVKVTFPGTARQTMPTIGQIMIRVHQEVIA